MEENPSLNKGARTQNFTVNDKERLWNILTDKLNADGGGYKSKEMWQKCWSDHKSEVKAKHLLRKKSRGKTGGGQGSIKEATDHELRVQALIGKDAINGLPVQESMPAAEVIPSAPENSQLGDVLAIINYEANPSEGY
ncbi:uncharacterized protein LOC129229772 [Uloborus diversus]|uniref:uncharacterized protein LOC129229772 n=1 Tax=Uloborus diversus TaxID=327109 RepID=UPI00240A1B9E|nr:uncharacterized protein LOC129229772 [Uloborus diversus]